MYSKGLPQLNLPPIDAAIRTEADGVTRIFDPIRGRYVALTPEEWVRQHFTHYMIAVLGYPRGLMANEIAITLNNTLKRCDTVVFDHSRRPQVIVEYKAPHIVINQKVFDQAVRYNSTLKVKLIVVSNGMSHYCCRVDYENRKVEFLKSMPRWDEFGGQ